MLQWSKPYVYAGRRESKSIYINDCLHSKVIPDAPLRPGSGYEAGRPHKRDEVFIMWRLDAYKNLFLSGQHETCSH